jgi:hypothetical protein
MELPKDIWIEILKRTDNITNTMCLFVSKSFREMCDRKSAIRKRDICTLSAELGYLEVLIWSRENRCYWNLDTCSQAALGGQLEVLKWCRENGYPWNHGTCSAAARGGHVEVLKYLRENGCPWDRYTSLAAKGGHLEVSQRERLSIGQLNF